MVRCRVKHPQHINRCVLEKGHVGPHKCKIQVITHFGEGACPICGGINIYKCSGGGHRCSDCGNRGD